MAEHDQAVGLLALEHERIPILARLVVLRVAEQHRIALALRGVFHPGESVVLYLTGNGYKGGPEGTALGPVIDADADAFRLAYEEVLA